MLRNKRRTLLTLISLSASTFLIVVLESMLRHLDDMPRIDGSERRLIVRRATSFRDPLPENYGPRILNIPGVHGICGLVLYWGIYKELKPEYFFGKLAIDPEKIIENYPETRVVDPETGKPRPELSKEFISDRRGASAGIGLYQKYGWKLGDKIVFQGTGFPDVEVTLRSCYDGPENSTFYFHRDYLEELMGRPGQVTFFNIICNSMDDAGNVSARVDAMFANSEAPTVTETERQFQGQFVSLLGNITVLLRAIAGACAFAMLCVAGNSLAITARERATEIAVMKSLGFTPFAVLILLLTEVVILCMSSTLAGAGGAKLLFSIDGPWHDVGNGFLLGFRIPADVFAAAFPLGILIGCASAIFPFVRVAYAPIAASLRRLA
ncbi:MAG: ABC transporter permease [Planctomycetota bacterium]